MTAVIKKRLEVLGIRSTHIMYMVSTVLTFKKVWLTNKCEIKVEHQKLTYAGDGQTFDRMYGYAASGSVEADVDDTELDEILWATAHTDPVAGPPSDDFTVRYFKGTSSENAVKYVGVRVALDCIIGSVGAPGAITSPGTLAVIRYTVLRAAFDPTEVPAFATTAKAGRVLSFSAYKTTTLIDGTSPTGMPSDGAMFMKDLIEDSTKFDPNGSESYT